jgi:hypothetical protein
LSGNSFDGGRPTADGGFVADIAVGGLLSAVKAG